MTALSTAPPADTAARRGRPGLALTAALAGGAWTLVMLARLFAGGTIGMADQGDSRRLMCQLGVRAARPFNADPSRYITTTWVRHQWYGEACGADGSGEPYRSSQLLLLRAAKRLTGLLHLPGALDLRVLGVLCALVVGLAVAALVLVLPGRKSVRLTFASLVGLAAADAAVAEYFVSSYSEPAAILGIIVLCPALLWLWHDGHSTWPRLVAVAGIAAFTITAKTQTLALLPALLLALLLVPHGPSGPVRRSRLGCRPLAWVKGRVPAAFACVLLVAAAATFLGDSPKRFEQVTSYDQVFLEILPRSHDPAADLRSLGVDPSLAAGSGRNILDPGSVARRPGYLAFRRDVNQVTLLRFYASHPARLLGLAAEGLRAVTVFRQDYLGTYAPGTGHAPGARECRICAYTAVFKAAGILPVLIVGLWAMTLATGIKVVRRRRLGDPQKAIGRLAVVLVTAAVGQFGAVMLTEGISDLYKHMILTNLLSALCLPCLAGCLWLLSGEPPRPAATSR